MQGLIIVMLSWLLCFYLPPAQAQTPQKNATGNQLQGALFKVTQGEHSLYLFGTIHVGAPDFYPLAPAVIQALERAPAIAMELDPGNMAAMQAAVVRHALYPAGQSLSTELSPRLQQQLQRTLKKYRIDPKTVERFRPWMLASLLTVQQFDRQGYRTELAVDGQLATMVAKNKKPIIELEGADIQMALFSALSKEQESLLLQESMKEANNPASAAKMVDLVNFWRKGDLKGLQKMLDDMAVNGNYLDRFTKEVLLDQRNPVMSDKIAQLLQQQDQVFVAVGILHLVGATGLPTLLSERGYQVERIR